MNKKYIIGIILVISIVILAILIQPQPFESRSDKIQVSASFYPLYFFAQQIGGEKADIKNITPEGAEPHDYEPTAQDIIHIGNSKLLILNGGGLEAWGDNIKQSIDPNRTQIVVAGEGLATEEVIEGGQKVINPHVWLSPPFAKQMVDKITQGFIRINPQNSDFYQSNADALKIRLNDLDAEYRQGLKDCKQNSIVTSHGAFGYLAATYHLNQVSVSGISPDTEPSSQQLGEVADLARRNNVKYIFFESLVSPKLSETIAHEIGAKTLALNPLEGLSDEEIARGRDYFTEMQNNLVNLQIALECRK